MALERDFELLDDYLSNRLNESDKLAFEKQIEGDPELKQELKVQREFVEGIRNARVAELKSMLNNVPVPPASNPTSLLVKAGTWTVVTGLVITGVYFYFGGNESKPTSNQTETAVQPEDKPKSVVAETEKENIETDKPAAPEATTPAPAKDVVKESVKPKKEGATAPKTSPVNPQVEAYDPTSESEVSEEVRKYEQESLENISKAFVTSSMEVETMDADKQYKFHYVFRGGKLVLYGAFEKNLYEILEFINNDKKTVVLFFKTNYYLLDINKSTPTLLTPIKDKALLKKLSQYRGH